MLFPLNITAGDSNGYLLGNLNLSLNVSPSYNVSAAPIKSIVHLKNKRLVNMNRNLYRKCLFNSYTEISPSTELLSIFIPGTGSFKKLANSF